MTDYADAKLDAQKMADETGLDVGLFPDVLGGWHAYYLPNKVHRVGRERSCEVIHCSCMLRIRPGHGP